MIALSSFEKQNEKNKMLAQNDRTKMIAACAETDGNWNDRNMIEKHAFSKRKYDVTGDSLC